MAEGSGSASSGAGGARTESAVIEDTIHRPGTIKINVTGAFITDEGSATPQQLSEEGVFHDTKDIRLPHHTSVVSHVAVDVSFTNIHEDRCLDLSLFIRLEVR